MAVQCLSINWLHVRTCVLRVHLCVGVRRCVVTVVCVCVCCACVECVWVRGVSVSVDLANALQAFTQYFCAHAYFSICVSQLFTPIFQRTCSRAVWPHNQPRRRRQQHNVAISAANTKSCMYEHKCGRP